MQKNYLQEINEKIDLPTKKMYLLDQEIKGLETLRNVAEMLYEEGQ